MKKLITILLLASYIFASDFSQDYEKTIEQAKKEHKSIYILMTSSSCGWCRKFENTTLKNKKVMDKLKSNYLLLHLDKDFDDYPEKFKVKRVPSHFFITSDEKIIYQFPGYWNDDNFLSFVDDINKTIEKAL